MSDKHDGWTYAGVGCWVHEHHHEISQENGRYAWYEASGMGSSGFAETLKEAKAAVRQAGEPGWMRVCAQPGEDIEPDQANAWAGDFVDCFGDTDGCATYTLWPDGAVTLAHPESDTYKVWRKKADA